MTGEENGSAIGEMTAQWKNSGNTGTYAMGYAPEGPDGFKGTDMPDFRKLRTVFSTSLVQDEKRFGRLLEIIDDMNCSSVERSVEVNRGTLGKYSDIVDFMGREAYTAIGDAAAADSLNPFLSASFRIWNRRENWNAGVFVRREPLYSTGKSICSIRPMAVLNGIPSVMPGRRTVSILPETKRIPFCAPGGNGITEGR